jgi:hypothetical protein
MFKSMSMIVGGGFLLGVNLWCEGETVIWLEYGIVGM